MFIPLHDHNPRRFLRWPWVTWAILAICLFLQARASLSPIPEDLIYRYGLFPASFSFWGSGPGGELPAAVQLLSYMWLHVGWFHLGTNMLFLWVLGDNIEDCFGHIRFLVFYLLCGVAGGLAYALLSGAAGRDAVMVGASGAISGVVAAYFLLHPRAKVRGLLLILIPVPVNLDARLCLGVWIIAQFAHLLWSANSDIAWLAHVGGLVAGAALVKPLKRREVPLFGD